MPSSIAPIDNDGNTATLSTTHSRENISNTGSYMLQRSDSLVGNRRAAAHSTAFFQDRFDHEHVILKPVSPLVRLRPTGSYAMCMELELVDPDSDQTRGTRRSHDTCFPHDANISQRIDRW
eukprot:GHVU01086799.1.p2 GENE.GHVU01086799.1~~GHVU01086799.1.p2  ORF type:complete len:121 (-),score=4.80 GHVU01086799.1:864-1226(-)